MRSINTNIVTHLEGSEIRIFKLLHMNIDSTDYYYTDCDVPIVHNANTYSPKKFEADTVSYSTDRIVDQLRIEIDNIDETLTPVFTGGTPQGSEVILSAVALDSDYQQIGLGSELLTNGGFETGDFTGWNNTAGGPGVGDSVAVNTNNPLSGTYSFELIRDGGEAGNLGKLSDLVTVSPSEKYRFSIQYDMTAWTADNAVIVVYDKTNTSTIEINFINSVSSGTWEVDFYVPVGCTSIEIQLYGTPDFNGTIYFDDVSLKQLNIEAIIFFQGQIGEWLLDESRIRMTVTNQFAQWTQETINHHSASCRWKVFKGTECAYSGGETWCDRSYTRCAALSNVANFGGFRWLPSIEDKVIWWGSTPKE